MEAGKLEESEQNLQRRDNKQQQTQLTCDTKCRNVTQALAVGGVCHSCTCSLEKYIQNIDCYCTHHLQQ